MSNRASVRVFYGLCFLHDSKEAAVFRGDGATEEPKERDSTPLALRIWGASREGVQAVTFGHTDYQHYGLALKGTVRQGDDWCALPISSLVRWRDIAKLRDYCAKHGLAFDARRLKWWAAPYYG